MKENLNIGLIGHKFMGRAHSHAYRDVGMFFDLKQQPLMRTLCGVEDDLPEACARYGFQNWEHDWRKVVDDPEIDIIDICTPDSSHAEIALAAAQRGKHIFCEKPLALTVAEAQAMADAAERNRVVAMVNFVYRAVPAVQLAKSLVAQGAIGSVYHFNALYQQDFCLPADFPFVWRMDRTVAGAGVLADKGAHVLDLARFLCGELSEVACTGKPFITTRNDLNGKAHEVTTDDAAVFIGRFENGALGLFEVSNASAGHKNALTFELGGSKGAIRFDLERLNELQVCFADDPANLQGFRTVSVTEKEHPFIAAWWPSGHTLGWEHAFIHQVYRFLNAVSCGGPIEGDFQDGLRCQKLIEAIWTADRERAWVKVQ